MNKRKGIESIDVGVGAGYDFGICYELNYRIYSIKRKYLSEKKIFEILNISF